MKFKEQVIYDLNLEKFKSVSKSERKQETKVDINELNKRLNIAIERKRKQLKWNRYK